MKIHSSPSQAEKAYGGKSEVSKTLELARKLLAKKLGPFKCCILTAASLSIPHHHFPSLQDPQMILQWENGFYSLSPAEMLGIEIDDSFVPYSHAFVRDENGILIALPFEFISKDDAPKNFHLYGEMLDLILTLQDQIELDGLGLTASPFFRADLEDQIVSTTETAWKKLDGFDNPILRIERKEDHIKRKANEQRSIEEAIGEVSWSLFAPKYYLPEWIQLIWH